MYQTKIGEKSIKKKKNHLYFVNKCDFDEKDGAIILGQCPVWDGKQDIAHVGLSREWWIGKGLNWIWLFTMFTSYVIYDVVIMLFNIIFKIN